MKRSTKTAAGVFAAAVTVVAAYEGLSTVAYRDVVGVPTICYGETDGVKMGMKVSRDGCKFMLQNSLKKYDDGMKACLTRDIPDGMHIAFISFTYNVGIAGFCHSTVARRANAGDFRGACDALLAWNRAGGRVIKGLDRRRRDERKQCLEGL